MKPSKLILLLFLLPLTSPAQQLSGLWIGSISNDSTTVRKDQSFEIILSEYKGKVRGYSRATFIVNDTLFYIVKRVKGTIDGDKCEVVDDYIVSHNFNRKVDKGVKVISTFYRNLQDSTWSLAGDWKTTQTKKFYSLTGKVDLKEEKDLSRSKLFPHLEELQLGNELPLYQEAQKKEVLVKTSIRPQQQSGISSATSTKPQATLVKNNTVPVDPTILSLDKKAETTVVPETQSGISNRPATPATTGTVKANTVAVDRNIITIDPKAETTITPEQQQAIRNNKPSAPATSSVKTNSVQVDRTIVSLDPKAETAIVPEAQKNLQQEKQAGTIPAASARNNTVTTPVVTPPVFAETKPAAPVDPSAAAAFVETRKMNPPQVVHFSSDSLVLALYDNGEVDGDTVSILLNGEMLMARQGLKASAIKKTIYIPAGQDETTLVLYAENLGKYPPNTGLLVVYDGDKRHDIRFSADLNKNASVQFRRVK